MSKVGDDGALSRTITATGMVSQPTVEATAEAVAVVDGGSPYQLLGEVARGGIGRIIKARDSRLDREVALKQLHDDRSGHARFLREAMLTARLQHPSIIPVHEIGRFASGAPFFAMKLVHGQSLRDAIRERATLEQRLELLPNVLAVADAIAYAHSERVIHRDLKPSNVLIGAFGETVVIDWGLAKDLDADDLADPVSPATLATGSVDATSTGAILGTPVYMPPEQALGQPVDERADVYALGALLYQLICADPPFEGTTTADVLDRVLHDAPIPISERVQGVPPDLCAIVTRSMARNPADRYRDARGLADDLRRFQLGQITALHAEHDAPDPRLDAELGEELRLRSLRPVRTICALALALNPLFWLSERHILPHRQPSMLAVRSAVELLVALFFACTWTRPGRRFSREIGVGVLMLLGAMMVVLNRLQDGQLQVGFTGSIMMVFLAYSTFPHMLSRHVVWALSTITALHVVVSATSRTMTLAILEQQMTLFICGIVLTALSVRFSYAMQRAEFYSRRRLEQANQRLARLER